MALARPQIIEHKSRTDAEGIDIMLAMDISGSMLARDFEPDRMVAAKEVAAAFINDRVGDRIGIAAFAGEAFTQSPLTTDKNSLVTMLARLRSGVIDDGTAIGNGLATAVNRLRESDAKSKVEITDLTLYHENWLMRLLGALALLMMEFIVSQLLLKRIP